MKKNKNLSSFEKIKHALKNDLFLYAFRNLLARVGIDIKHYYWVQEEFEPCERPIIKDDSSKYTLIELSLDKVISIIEGSTWVSIENATKAMEGGQICLGLETEGKIAAYNFIELKDFKYKGREFKLKPNEVYLTNMWTFHDYRGKNLAPYLRYESYRFLEKQGRDIKYSITDSLNKSSIRFKKKLNSKHLYFFLGIVLFKKIKWNFTLKKYD